MKENIESNNIGNRKFILELRFAHKVCILDKRGEILEKLVATKVIPNSEWEIGAAEINIRDSKDKEDALNVIGVSLNRLYYISYHIDSIESFRARFIKIVQVLKDVVGNLTIQRIGCRIIGSYYIKSDDYKTLLNNFMSSFPSKFLTEKYPSKDFRFQLEYQNGMYQIGPLNKEDEFYNREFSVPNCKKHIGVAIDTDNYITNESRVIDEASFIKDVYALSLSVEKELYQNLKDY